MPDRACKPHLKIVQNDGPASTGEQLTVVSPDEVCQGAIHIRAPPARQKSLLRSDCCHDMMHDGSFREHLSGHEDDELQVKIGAAYPTPRDFSHVCVEEC